MSTRKYIIIEGEALSAVEEIVHRRTTLPEWLSEMNKLTPTVLTTPVLPVGAVLYAQKGTQQLVAINQPAGVKKVIWRGTAFQDPDQRSKTRWTLAMPPHVFVLVFRLDALVTSHIFFVPKTLTSDQEQLHRTCLANIYSTPGATGISTHICAGSIRLDVKLPFAERCQKFIDLFWETEFNDDIQPVIDRRNEHCVFSAAVPAQLRNLHAWDKATADDADFLSKMDWPFAPVGSLSEILTEQWAAS